MIDNDTIIRIVAAGVRDTITAHGNIVEGSWAGSLGKRVANQIRRHIAAQSFRDDRAFFFCGGLVIGIAIAAMILAPVWR